MSSGALSRMHMSLVPVGVTIAALFAGCGGGSTSGSGDSTAPAKAGGTLRIAQQDEVITLDPIAALDGPSINVISQINETLFKTNENNEFEPLLVESFEQSADQRTWTFQLRKGVTFSTGKPMTSEDVVFSLEAGRKSPSFASLFEGIKQIRAAGPLTVVVKAAVPVPELPAVLTEWFTVVVPKNYGGVSKQEFAVRPVGTGPFMMGPWKRGESLTLEKNPTYWKKGQPLLDTVVFEAVTDDNSRVSQLKGGELNAVNYPPWSQLASVESTPGLEVNEYAEGVVRFLVLNADNPLFKDRRVREAMSLAIDREAIVETALSGRGNPAGSWLPPAYLDHNPNIKPQPHDLVKAKKLLGEAVADGNLNPSFTLTSYSGETFWSTTAQIVQQDLEEVGFSVKIKPVDLASSFDVLGSGEYDAAAAEVYSCLPTPLELVSFYLGSGGLFSGADTTEVSKLAEMAAREIVPAKRRDLYYQIQEIIDNEKYLLSLSYNPYVYATQDDVTGFEVNTTGTPWLTDVGFSG